MMIKNLGLSMLLGSTLAINSLGMTTEPNIEVLCENITLELQNQYDIVAVEYLADKNTLLIKAGNKGLVDQIVEDTYSCYETLKETAITESAYFREQLLTANYDINVEFTYINDYNYDNYIYSAINGEETFTAFEY